MESKVWWIVIVSIVVLGGLALVITPAGDMVGTFAQSIFSSTFTPVYCNDPTSACCVKTVTHPTETIDYNLYGSCPVTASASCVISNVQDQTGEPTVTLYYGSQNCRIVQKYIPIAKVYVCDDQQTVTVKTGTTAIEIPRGYIYFTDVYSGKATVTRDTYGEKLITNLGAPIQSSCTYVAPAGTKITNSQFGSLGASYTVPVGAGVGTSDSCILTWNAGNRHICGNLEEQCSVDSDCTGHTYGTKECYQRTLQTYGCTQLGLPSGLSEGFLGQRTDLIFAPVGSSGTSQSSNNYGVTSRCEVVSASAVQCCGDTDCGSNLVCDKVTFTCKANVQCSRDSDCGVSTQCDYSTKQLKTPDCISGQCGWSTKSVGCCVDSNCADTQTCDLTTYVCKDKPVVKELCPTSFGCCSGDTLYFDKPCSSGQYCVNHQCGVKPQCTSDNDCDSGFSCKDGLCKAVTNETCQSSLFGLVERHIGTKEECAFLCQIGLKSPEKINVCVTNYAPAVLVGIFVLGLVAILVFGLKGRGGKPSHKVSAGQSSGKSFLKSKTFWKVVAGIVGVVLLILYFKILIWVAIGILVVLIVDAIFLRRKIWKAVKKIFRG